MLYYVRISSGPHTHNIKGPFISLRIAKYVAYHLKPIPGLSAATITIEDKFYKVISCHIEKWG